MSISIEVIAAFDFLDKEITIGTLEYERIKGNASYRFSYDENFLKRAPRLTMSADLGNYLGTQSLGDTLCSFLGDALPDRWGRALIDKRERLKAKDENRMARVFDDFDYLVRIDDTTRMGAIRLKYNGKYIGTNNEKRNVPPLTNLEQFIREAQMIEEAERRGAPYEKLWIDNVWKPGSSLGGARPKLNIIDNDELWIAKIPSVKDTYDIAVWEHFSHLLAKKADIKTAETRLIRVGPTPYHTMLSKRFDRNGDKRIHFASSLTLTGFHDGDNASNDKGYIDIVDAMAGNAGIRSLSNNAEELFRRIAFNIMIGNHDDHFRNHGFLLTQKGWELSPAYDMNPANQLTQSLAITPNTNESSLRLLLEASDYYLITRVTATDIIKNVLSSVKQWRQTAKNIGIKDNEQERFAKRIEWSIEEANALLPQKTIINKPVMQTNKKKGGPKM
jgi:serine/threonine-protein kinase HipA